MRFIIQQGLKRILESNAQRSAYFGVSRHVHQIDMFCALPTGKDEYFASFLTSKDVNSLFGLVYKNPKGNIVHQHMSRNLLQITREEKSIHTKDITNSSYDFFREDHITRTIFQIAHKIYVIMVQFENQSLNLLANNDTNSITHMYFSDDLARKTKLIQTALIDPIVRDVFFNISHSKQPSYTTLEALLQPKVQETVDNLYNGFGELNAFTNKLITTGQLPPLPILYRFRYVPFNIIIQDAKIIHDIQKGLLDKNIAGTAQSLNYQDPPFRQFICIPAIFNTDTTTLI